ncbi:MAG: hypothetical protein A2V90_03600 [Gammaproteobacteria bacterium RBG_16_57_12]|nr:MAG: hypothetical protein A2V90_03600 [Gammaproteobacteria bacterium RBG_16_57_12]
MINKKKQQGITMLGMVMVVSLVAFFAYLIIRLAPLYIESVKVDSILKSLAADPDMRDAKPRDIVETLMKRFDIDDVSRVTKDDIYVETVGGSTLITIDYNAEAPMTSSVKVVVHYHYEQEV